MKLKRLFFCLVAVFCVCAALALPVCAEEQYVFDEANILSSSERSRLETAAAEISRRYDCGVYIFTVQDYRTYTTGSVYSAAKAIYTDNALGVGSERSGIMLFLSMWERDYQLIAYGYGNTAFTDYGKEQLARKFLDNFKRDDWYGGFSDYIETSGDFLERARAGKPVDIDAFHSAIEELKDILGFAGLFWLILGVPCLIAYFVCRSAKKNMKSVAKATNAEFFAVPDSFDLRLATDDFSHVTETRVRIESDSDRDGGGSSGGTSVDSDGFSGSGGKF